IFRVSRADNADVVHVAYATTDGGRGEAKRSAQRTAAAEAAVAGNLRATRPHGRDVRAIARRPEREGRAGNTAIGGNRLVLKHRRSREAFFRRVAALARTAAADRAIVGAGAGAIETAGRVDLTAGRRRREDVFRQQAAVIQQLAELLSGDVGAIARSAFV